MRRVLFWMHLGAGVLVGAVIIFFSVTGALLAYERQIIRAVDAHSYAQEPAQQNTARIPLDLLVARAVGVLSVPLDSLTVHAEANAPVEIETAKHEVYFADAYSAKMQGPMSPRVRAFFAEITALHRWFGLSNAHHATAIVVKGAVTLLLLFLLLSGAMLWLPKRWTPATLRTGLITGIVPRFDGHSRARNYNWHKVTGFWIGLPLATVVGTGVIMAYPWANALLFRFAGSPVPVRNQNRGLRRNPGRESALPIHLDEIFAAATNGNSDWQTATLRFAPNATGGWNVSVDRSEGGHPEKREQVTVSGKTLRVELREQFAGMNRGQRWRAWVRFLHTGEAGGLWGETLAVLTATGAVVLSITGIALSLDRLRRYRISRNMAESVEVRGSSMTVPVEQR